MEKYLFVEAASALSGVPASTLRHYRATDTGPESFKIGRRVVWPRESLLAWMEEQRTAMRRGGTSHTEEMLLCA